MSDPRTPTDDVQRLRGLLKLALMYLEHPDVTAINFAMGSDCAARRIRNALGMGDRLVSQDGEVAPASGASRTPTPDLFVEAQ